MTRISKEIATKMANRIVIHALDAKGTELREREKKLFFELADMRRGPQLDPHMDAIEKIAGETFPRITTVSSRVNGLYVNIGGTMYRDGYEPTAGDRALHNARWRMFLYKSECPRVLTDSAFQHDSVSEDLANRLRQYALDRKTFHQEIEAKVERAEAAVRAFSTYKRLCTEWPDVLPLVSDLIPEGNRGVPVVCVEALNAEFDLPPETAAE